MPNMPSTPLNSDYEAPLDGAELRAVQSAPPPGLEKSQSIRRTISVRMRRAVHAMQSPNLKSHKKRQQVLSPLPPVPEGQVSEQKPALQSHSPSDVGGPRFGAQSSAVHQNLERYAGEPTVYRTHGDEVGGIFMRDAVPLHTDNLIAFVGRTHAPRASFHKRNFTSPGVRIRPGRL